MPSLTFAALPCWELGVIAENFVCKTPHKSFLGNCTLIYRSCFYPSFTFNQPFNQRGILPTICEYKLMCDLE